MEKVFPIATILLVLACIQLSAMSFQKHEEIEELKEKLTECQEQSVLDKLKERFPQK